MGKSAKSYSRNLTFNKIHSKLYLGFKFIKTIALSVFFFPHHYCIQVRSERRANSSQKWLAMSQVKLGSRNGQL